LEATLLCNHIELLLEAEKPVRPCFLYHPLPLAVQREKAFQSGAFVQGKAVRSPSVLFPNKVFPIEELHFWYCSVDIALRFAVMLMLSPLEVNWPFGCRSLVMLTVGATFGVSTITEGNKFRPGPSVPPLFESGVGHRW